MVRPALGRQLLETGHFASDFIIECQGVEFKVHRVILGCASPVLRSLCAGRFKEAAERRVRYDDMIPSILSRVIHYLYTNEYDPKEVPAIFRNLCTDPPELGFLPAEDAASLDLEENEQEYGTQADGEEESAVSDDNNEAESTGMEQMVKTLKINAMVYKYADYLQVQGLAKLASDRFLKDTQKAYLQNGFEQALETMFENTPTSDRTLRLQVLTFLTENHEQLRDKKQLNHIMDYYTDGYWAVCTKLLEEQKKLAANRLQKQINKITAALRSQDLRCKHRSAVGFQFKVVSSPRFPGLRRLVFSYGCGMCPKKHRPTCTIT